MREGQGQARNGADGAGGQGEANAPMADADTPVAAEGLQAAAHVSDVSINVWM